MTQGVMGMMASVFGISQAILNEGYYNVNILDNIGMCGQSVPIQYKLLLKSSNALGMRYAIVSITETVV